MLGVAVVDKDEGEVDDDDDDCNIVCAGPEGELFANGNPLPSKNGRHIKGSSS